MDRQVALDMHEELTKTQNRFKVFVIKSRIEELINVKNLKEVLSNMRVVEDFKRKKEKTQDIFELNNELESLKQQLFNFLTPNENQSNTYSRLVVVQNIVSDLAANYKEMTSTFFNSEKCKGVLEKGFTPLHQMMKVFRESCQKHLKANSNNKNLKQSDFDEIAEIIDHYIKDNTNQFIQKSSNQEFTSNVDVSYSHLLYLQQQLTLNLEDVVEFIEEKSRLGLDFKYDQTAEEYLLANGINMKVQRENIEKRKESLKNISQVKGIKNKEPLEDIANHIKADERWLDIIVQIIENLMLMKKDVYDRLVEQMTFPPSFKIPEGKEITYLREFIEEIKNEIGKAMDNFEDPIEVHYTTLTTEGPEPKNEDKIVRFSSIGDNFSQDGEKDTLTADRILKDHKPSAEFRLQKIKLSVTRSMRVVFNFLDYIVKQIMQHQENEKKYIDISRGHLILMEKVGRTYYLDLYDGAINMKSNFEQYSTGTTKMIPVQLKFLLNILNTIKEKYINYIHELIYKRYEKETFFQIGMILRKVDQHFDLHQIAVFLRDNIATNENKQIISKHLDVVKESFHFAEEQFNHMEEIVDEIHKTIGNPQSLQWVSTLVGDIEKEDLMYFWQKLCNQVSNFYTSYEDIKKKKLISTNESELRDIFSSKINNLLKNADNEVSSLAKEICESYIQLILKDYDLFQKQVNQEQQELIQNQQQNRLKK